MTWRRVGDTPQLGAPQLGALEPGRPAAAELLEALDEPEVPSQTYGLFSGDGRIPNAAPLCNPQPSAANTVYPIHGSADGIAI